MDKFKLTKDLIVSGHGKWLKGASISQGTKKDYYGLRGVFERENGEQSNDWTVFHKKKLPELHYE